MRKLVTRLIAIVLTLIMAIGMTANVAAAETGCVVTLDCSPKEVHPGDTIVFTLTIDNGEDEVCGAMGYVYPSENLQFVKAENDGVFMQNTTNIENKFVIAAESAAAKKSLSISYTYTVSKDAKPGDRVTFKVENLSGTSGNTKPDNPVYPLSIEDIKDPAPCEITVTAKPTVTPTAESTPTTNPTPTAEPSTSPETTPTTDPTPTIAPTASPTATPTNTPAPTENPWSGWIPPTGSYTPPTSGNNIPGPGESSAEVNKTGLNSAIGVAKNTLAGGTNYSAEAASALSSAIAKAEAISSDPNATQAQVDAGTALVDAVSAAAARTVDGKAYTDETIAALNAALAEAKAVCDDPAATIEQINNVIGKLNAAVAGLTEAPAATEPPKDDVPKTSDESTAVWPFALLMLAAGAAAVVLFRKRSLNGR